MPRLTLELDGEKSINYIIDSHEMKKFSAVWKSIWDRRRELYFTNYFVVARGLDDAYTIQSKVLEKKEKKKGEFVRCECATVEETSISEYPYLKNVKVKEGYSLFCSRINAMCLKKFYNSINHYMGLGLGILGILLILTTTKLAVSTDVSQSWQELQNNEQALSNLHINFFIDTGGEGESIAMFTNISRNMAESMRCCLQKICKDCIASQQNPKEFFKSMPYRIQRPIPSKYLVNEVYKTKQKLLSFTYGLPELSKTFKISSGAIRPNKTLVIYYNTEFFHSSFRTLNFGHNLALL